MLSQNIILFFPRLFGAFTEVFNLFVFRLVALTNEHRCISFSKAYAH
jgi:hypothetical protein